jgi:hypothetical protein
MPSRQLLAELIYVCAPSSRFDSLPFGVDNRLRNGQWGSDRAAG